MKIPGTEMEFCAACGFIKQQCECKKPQTNAERIRNMADAELAEILFGSCLENMGREQCNNFHKKGCKHCVVEWLKSEVKE